MDYDGGKQIPCRERKVFAFTLGLVLHATERAMSASESEPTGDSVLIEGPK